MVSSTVFEGGVLLYFAAHIRCHSLELLPVPLRPPFSDGLLRWIQGVLFEPSRIQVGHSFFKGRLF
jgi:hypothetical protein